jgi:hypothetical protein
MEDELAIPLRLEDAVDVLGRTPATLRALLYDAPAEWTGANEGEDTFSPWEVVAHLLYGERVDWMTRLRIIIEHGESRPFDPFDRRAHRAVYASHPIADLLDEFGAAREANLRELAELAGGGLDLELAGAHPELGRVTARQLLATWVVHDLGHVRQIARTMARQYSDEVGPWRAYLPVLDA